MGVDIVGKIYDAEGNLIRDAFRLNTNRSSDDERDFDIAATNDGGFVLAYIDDDTADTDQQSIYLERFTATGSVVFSPLVVDDFLGPPTVTVDLTTNDVVVTFASQFNTDGTDIDVEGIPVAADGIVGSQFNADSNAASDDQRQDIAVLSIGNIVSVYLDGSNNLDVLVLSQTGGAMASSEAFATGGGENGVPPQVAALADGGFVVVAEVTPGADVLFRV